MDNITEEKYNKIRHEHDELIELIISRTVELANILHGRDPIGTCEETDFDIQDGSTLLVQFEKYSCGDYDYDSYYLPLEFLFSEDYRKNYKIMIEYKKIDDERKRIEAKDAKFEKDRKQMEDYDIAEYERLKAKYED